MKISEVIEKLNAALEQYGDIPVNMNVEERYDDVADIEDIRADEESVTLYDF